MKKLCLVALAAIFSLTAVNAQDVKYGPKLGLNLASLNGDDADELDGRTSFNVGGAVEIPISEKFSFQPEFLYSAQGAKFEETFVEQGISVDTETTIRLDYINVPLMAKYYVAEGFSLEVGPQIGILLTSEAEVEASAVVNGETVSASETQDLKDDTNGIDFGVNLGLGYTLENGLNFGARYNLGLSNVNDFEGSDDIKTTNGVFQISVGYFFN